MVVCSMRDFEPRYRNESKKLSLCAAYGNWLKWAFEALCPAAYGNWLKWAFEALCPAASSREANEGEPR
jgi:hypothetical protein